MSTSLLGRPRAGSGFFRVPELGRQRGEKSAGTTIPGGGSSADSLTLAGDTLCLDGDALVLTRDDQVLFGTDVVTFGADNVVRFI